jgi:site-specific DNA-cytosine methylase
MKPLIGTASRRAHGSSGLFDELIVDNFAGGGGASRGIEAAVGRAVDVAINHSRDAVRMHEVNHPHTRHLCEDVWTVDPLEATGGKPVGLAWFSPDCFPAGTMILTHSGLKPIEAVKAGEMVLTHRGRWCPVGSTLAREADTVEVRGHGHYGLVTTPNHPFYSKTITRRYPSARHKGAKRVGTLRSLVENAYWPEAHRMAGRLWATPKAYPESAIPTCAGAEFSESFFYLVGRWVGDGSLNKGDVEICCGLAECDAFADRLDGSPLKRADGQELRHRVVDHGSSKLFVWGNIALVEWLRSNFGNYCHAKGLPPWCLAMQAGWRRALLDGYVDADGSSGVRTEVKTVSRALAVGIRLLAVSLGYAAALYRTEGKPGQIEGRSFVARDSYTVAWREEPQRETVMWDTTHMFSPVREVTPAGRQMVYSLEVAGDESYVADGIVVHNCRHFSRAKGGKPVQKRIRGLAWIVIKWAKAVRPRVIILENVREFQDWGPLTGENRPCPDRKGNTFRRWQAMLRNLGYVVDFRVLNAADFGAPTHRRRFFLVARRDGRPIAWPVPTHGPGRPMPYRTAAECIDWSLPCPSIFLSREQGRAAKAQRPLAEKTMRRIAMGLKRYVLDNPRPFIVTCNHGGPEFRGQPVGEPMRTITAARDAHGVVAPFLAGVGGRTGQGNVPVSAGDAPVGTVTAKNDRAVVAPFIARCAHGDTSATGKDRWGNGHHGPAEPLPTVTGSKDFAAVAPYLVEVQNGSNDVGHRAVDRPAHTITAHPKGGGMAMAAPFVTQYFGGSPESRAKPLADPLPTITADDHNAMVAPVLVQTGYGERDGQAPRALDLGKPLGTVVGSPKHALVAGFLAKHYGGVVGHAPDRPLGTITSIDHHSVVAGHLLKNNHGSHGVDPAEPLHTVTTGGRHGVVASHLSKFYGTNVGADHRGPMPTVTADGNHLAEVRAFLMRYYSSGGQAGPVDAPAPTVTTKDRLGVVTVAGADYQIVDIGLRMLSPAELLRAQFGKYAAGYTLLGTKTQQVAAIGNSVPPELAEAVVTANWVEADEAAA